MGEGKQREKLQSEMVSDAGEVPGALDHTHLLEVAPLLVAGRVLQGLNGHQLSLLHTWQVQVTFVDLPQGTIAQLLHEAHG